MKCWYKAEGWLKGCPFLRFGGSEIAFCLLCNGDYPAGSISTYSKKTRY
jgi:hypothetical protein